MREKHICFIVPNYPTKSDPMYTFVRELVVQISKMNTKVSVIAPQSITNFLYKKKRKRPFHWKDNVDDTSIEVYQPIHFPFLNFNIFNNNLSGMLTSLAIKYSFKKNNINPDVLYSHFWHSGVIAAEIASKKNIPVFIASGESKIWVQKLYSRKKIDNALSAITGMIFVSKKNYEESKQLDLCKINNFIISPNAVNTELFYKQNKKQTRKKLGIAENDFVLVFTGSFNKRKGIRRIEEAVESLPDIKLIYIGSGELEPQGKNIIFSGRLPHIEINDYLNAADVFILPTLAEGSSNAIIEAMACGLPIISSNLPFNDEILSEDNSILINPMNINEIRNAIIFLKNNEQARIKMGENSLIKANDLKIENRARVILDFIEKSTRVF